MITLQGKVAIVTGAAHGIGLAIAEVFREAGAAVFTCDIEDPQPCDVSRLDDVRALVSRAAAHNGRIDVLCNNAAFLGEFHDALEAGDEEWRRSFEVGLLGAQYCTREVLPYMIRQTGGSIINIASVQALVGGRSSVAYTSIKSALLGFTRSVATDYGKHNIRVNAICPGAIQTRISPRPGEELYERQVGKTLLGRVGQPREIAYAALFLASDEASYITGAVLPVDGGWTAV